MVRRFYQDIVGPYWPPERRYIDDGYRTIPFPFAEIKAPPIRMGTQWTLSDYVGYLRTWPATQRYQQAQQRDPVEMIGDSLATAWGDTREARTVLWPIYVRAGRV